MARLALARQRFAREVQAQRFLCDAGPGRLFVRGDAADAGPLALGWALLLPPRLAHPELAPKWERSESLEELQQEYQPTLR